MTWRQPAPGIRAKLDRMVFRLPIWMVPHLEGVANGYAILRGGKEERLIGGFEAGLMAVQIAARGLQLPPLRVDSVTVPIEFLFVYAVMLRSNKAWPMAYCAVVLVSAMALAAELIVPVDRWASGTAAVVWDTLESLILITGTRRTSRAAGAEIGAARGRRLVLKVP